MGNSNPKFCNTVDRGERSSEHDNQAEKLEPLGNVFEDTLRNVTGLDKQLLLFAGGQNIVFVRWLLLLGADPRVADSNGTTPLHVAARSGSVMIVRDLLARGAHVNARDNFFCSPLHIACTVSRRRVMRDLMDAFADINSVTHANQTPLELAADKKAKFIILQSLSISGDIIAGKLTAKNHRSNRKSDLLGAEDVHPIGDVHEGVLGDPIWMGRSEMDEIDPDDDDVWLEIMRKDAAIPLEQSNNMKSTRRELRRNVAKKLRENAQMDKKLSPDMAMKYPRVFVQ